MQPIELDEIPIVHEVASRAPRIAGYRMLRRLGVGGMAMVYLAVQESLDREVAIKVMRPTRQLDEAQSARFEHEARIIAKLEHPGIVGIHEVGRTLDGDLYYVMPYLARGDLGERDYRDDEGALIALLRVLLDALGYAHARGIVHRDVKAENVLFDNADRPQLADFGIALAHKEGDIRVTGDGLAIGSSAQMSPEQARAGAIDGRSDLYSLGVLVFELLSGELPYQAPDSLAVALMHAHDPIPRLPDDKAHWQDFIDRSMAKRPEQRFRNAQAMQRALDPIQTHLRRRMSPLGRARDLVRTSPGLLIALGALLSVSLLSVLLTLMQDRPVSVAPTPEPTVIAVEEPDSGIARMLADARSQLNSGDLIVPVGANAAENYLAVLARDAGNVEARRGFDEVLSASAIALVDAAKRGEHDLVRDRLALMAGAAERAGTPNAPSWDAMRAQVGDAAVARARLQIDAHERTDALAWLETARTLGVQSELWSDLQRQASALVQAGASMQDSGGPPLRVVPPRLGNSSMPKALLVMRDEVTRGEYAQFSARTGRAATRCRNRLSPLRLFDRRDWRDPGFKQSDAEPVVCVSVDDAEAYAAWLSQRTAQRYRLPTRTEWRHAAPNNGSRTSACARGNILDSSAAASAVRNACSDGHAYTAASGRYPANTLGINDMSGNVGEWTRDCDATPRAVAGERCTRRIAIGLSWRDGTDVQPPAERMLEPDRGYDDVGFRLVREL